MNKFLTRLLCAAAMTCVVATADAATDEAGNKFIYLASGRNNLPPHVQYADEWEEYKVPETAPGSNIYETVVKANDAVFHFHYDLADTSDPSKAWLMNVIHPAHYDYMMPVMQYVGKSGICSSSDVEMMPVYFGDSNHANDWQITPKPHRIRLDLNEMKIYAIPEGHMVLAVNDDSDFSLGRLDRYTSFNYINNYYEPCDELRIRIYDPIAGQWQKPVGGNILQPGKNNTLEFAPASGSGVAFVAPDWKGGVIKGGYQGDATHGSFDILSDAVPKFEPLDFETIYPVGDYSGWVFTEASRLPGEEAIYEIEFPVGTTYFQIYLGNSWDSSALGSDNNATIVDGNKVINLRVRSGGESACFPSPLTAPVTVTFNLTAGTATFPADVDLTMPPVTVGNIPSVNRNALFVQTPYDPYTPWKDCSDAVLSNFQSLQKVSDNTYSGNIYVPAGEFSLRFISEFGAKGSPNTVIAPSSGKDRELVVSGKDAYSSAAMLADDRAGYWTYAGRSQYDMWWGGDVKVTVTTGDSPSVAFDFYKTQDDTPAYEAIYLVGTPQGWDPADGSMPLYPTTNGGYYGTFDIPAGPAEFRFLTSLDSNWDLKYSIGSYSSSFEAERLTLDERASCNLGSDGNWSLDWWGGMMYVYVSTSSGGTYLYVSRNPISFAGEIIDPATSRSVYIYHNGEYAKLAKNSDGLYQGQFYIDHSSDTDSFRLFTKKLPISSDEPEWEGSYSITPVGNGMLEIDEFGVAESAVTFNEGLTTGGAEPFSFKPSSVERYAFVSVDMDNNRVYVEPINCERGTYVYGGLTGVARPTYANRAEFAGHRIPYTGGIIDVPAGKLDICFSQTIADAYDYPGATTAEFTDGVAVCNDGMGWWRVQSPGWKGGKVLVSRNHMVDMSTVHEITACYILSVYPDYEEARVTFTETAPGSLVYKGKCSFRADMAPSMYFQFKQISQGILAVTSRKAWCSGIFGYIFDDEGTVIPANGSVTVPVGFSGAGYNAYNLSFPSLVGDGDMDMTVDLNTATLSVTVSPDNEGLVYEAVSGGNPDLDGITGYSSADIDNGVVIETLLDGGPEGGYDFNLASPDGTVIVPASGATTLVEFDEAGVWSGQFVKRPAARSRSAVRKAASQEATWHFDMPGESNSAVSMLVDEANSRLTIFSSAHNNGYFILSPGHTAQGITNLEQMRSQRLTRSGSGMYVGEITVDDHMAGEVFRVNFFKSCSYSYGLGINTPVWDDKTMLFDLTGDNLVVSNPAYPENSGRFGIGDWYVKAPAGKVAVSFDPVSGILTASRGNSGVENVLADGDGGISVFPGEGRVTIVSSVRASVAVYSVTGVLVRMVDVLPGQTVVELPAGLYIVNRSKLYVR